MKIIVVGTGYVGLVSGVCLSKFGSSVVCVDSNPDKVETLNKGQVPFFEPGLGDMMRNNTSAGRLTFSTHLGSVIAGADVCFLCVGTPPNPDGTANLSYVEQVAREIGRTISEYKIVITKSTVPVGTSEKVRAWIQEELDSRNAKIDFDLVSNPEFLREGTAVSDFLKPDRVVIGTDCGQATEIMRELYSFLPQEKLMFMDIVSSEMTKYAANTMLATRISFMNEIANICERVGADVEKVRLGIGTDERIGMAFLRAGCGYGGSCFPKDVRALSEFAKVVGYRSALFDAVETVNEQQKKTMFEKISAHFGGEVFGKTIGIWGLSFKPKTSDVRDAPAQTLILQLIQAGAKVQAHDPKAIKETREVLGELKGVLYVNHQYDAVNGADALALLTEWDIYKQPDFGKIKSLLKENVIFDGRNQYSLAEMKRQGFTYYSIGRTVVR
ncbi:UDP-glucose 6-dehydrogenase [Planctomycetales bacterium]|nr:UDP-glucose 6-dehydrogenase [Planctomycetales bacterium]